jgi:hypothetical protein
VAIIRKNKGFFIAASCVFIPHVATAATVEALAMHLGLELADQIGVMHYKLNLIRRRLSVHVRTGQTLE